MLVILPLWRRRNLRRILWDQTATEEDVENLSLSILINSDESDEESDASVYNMPLADRIEQQRPFSSWFSSVLSWAGISNPFALEDELRPACDLADRVISNMMSPPYETEDESDGSSYDGPASSEYLQQINAMFRLIEFDSHGRAVILTNDEHNNYVRARNAARAGDVVEPFDFIGSATKPDEVKMIGTPVPEADIFASTVAFKLVFGLHVGARSSW